MKNLRLAALALAVCAALVMTGPAAAAGDAAPDQGGWTAHLLDWLFGWSPAGPMTGASTGKGPAPADAVDPVAEPADPAGDDATVLTTPPEEDGSTESGGYVDPNG